jgi:hypothetical protein
MEKETIKKLNRKIAISVAIISTFMAVTKIKDDNIVQAMAKAKADSVDVWNQYQAKKIKFHLAEAALAQNRTLKLVVPAQKIQLLEAQEQEIQKAIEKYQAEAGELAQKAQEFEKRYDALNIFDDQFDLSDACLSLALMLLAVAALTAEPWLLLTSWGLGALGFLFGVSGFAGWNIHPDWIIRYLS